MGLLFGGACLLTQGCSSTEAVTGPPAVATYDYDYYPDWNVYYSASDGTYHWYDNGQWRAARHLPPRYASRTARHETVTFDTQTPWTAPASDFEGVPPRPYPWPTPDDFAAHGY
ncbi:MAG TPA: hypothetical protein VMU04_25650 [Candidatus Acidoferrum sp.]|nr:hypothetical protein [Candidatus Acidoferrum sp.]